MAKISPEMVMVNAATKALEFRTRRPLADADEAIKHIINSGDFKGEEQIYAIAAINEIFKLKRGYKTCSDKEIIQMFVDNIYETLAKIKE